MAHESSAHLSQQTHTSSAKCISFRLAALHDAGCSAPAGSAKRAPLPAVLQQRSDGIRGDAWPIRERG